jgi:hypothetical protein
MVALIELYVRSWNLKAAEATEHIVALIHSILSFFFWCRRLLLAVL